MQRFRSMMQTEFLAGVRLTAFMMLLSQAMLASSMYSAIASCAEVCALAVASRQLFKPRGVVSSICGGPRALESELFTLAFVAAACSAFRAVRFGSPVLKRPKFKQSIKRSLRSYQIICHLYENKYLQSGITWSVINETETETRESSIDQMLGSKLIDFQIFKSLKSRFSVSEAVRNIFFYP